MVIYKETHVSFSGRAEKAEIRVIQWSGAGCSTTGLWAGCGSGALRPGRVVVPGNLLGGRGKKSPISSTC